MPPKPPSREEEFELVLGNKQLLSLFFIVVGFFAAFFSVGYMVGFGHGEKASGTSTVARAQEPAPKAPEPSTLPPTLLQEPPPSIPAADISKPSPSQSAASPSPAPAPPPPKTTPAPETKAKPTQTAAAKRPEPTPAPAAKKPAPKPQASAPVAGAGGSYFLQVAAVRVASDATELAGKLKAKGYPATVNAGKNDGWQRVVVGPFQSAEAAGAFKTKLSKDGFETMLRKL